MGVQFMGFIFRSFLYSVVSWGGGSEGWAGHLGSGSGHCWVSLDQSCNFSGLLYLPVKGGVGIRCAIRAFLAVAFCSSSRCFFTRRFPGGDVSLLPRCTLSSRPQPWERRLCMGRRGGREAGCHTMSSWPPWLGSACCLHLALPLGSKCSSHQAVLCVCGLRELAFLLSSLFNSKERNLYLQPPY